MSRWTRFIPMVAIGLVVAACGVDPVGTDPMADTLAPRMDSGYATGGSATGGAPGGGTTTTTSTSSTTEGTIIPPDSTSRGGYGTGGS